jgi:hypothetical protein
VLQQKEKNSNKQQQDNGKAGNLTEGLKFSNKLVGALTARQW